MPELCTRECPECGADVSETAEGIQYGHDEGCPHATTYGPDPDAGGGSGPGGAPA